MSVPFLSDLFDDDNNVTNLSRRFDEGDLYRFVNSFESDLFTEKDKELNIGDQDEKLKTLKESQKKLESEIKKLNDRWTKECELVTKLIDLRKQKFVEDIKEAEKKKIDGQIPGVEK